MEDLLPGIILGMLFGSTLSTWLLPRLIVRRFEMRFARRLHPSNARPKNVYPFPHQREAE